jgi:pyruvate/2-oxoglutarate dehydrogenase complex dihydrolipoamide acyltransferase (E2) component
MIPPEMGEGVEVRVLLWYRAEGEAIAAGDALVELETDKAVALVTARQAGTLRRCFAVAGDWLKPGEVAAWVSDSPEEPLPAERDTAAEAMLATYETT